MELPIGGEYDLGALRWHSPIPPNEPLPSSSPGRYPKNWQLLQVSFLSVILIPPLWPVIYIVTDVILSVFYRQDKDWKEDFLMRIWVVGAIDVVTVSLPFKGL